MLTLKQVASRLSGIAPFAGLNRNKSIFNGLTGNGPTGKPNYAFIFTG